MIIVPIHTTSGPSRIELINQAALEYSNNGNLQEAFRAGARWADVDSASAPTFFQVAVFITVIIFVAINAGGLIFGLMDGSMSYTVHSPLTSKWRFAIPAYNWALAFSQWMSS